ncbi:MATE family efflux transporter [Metamycoplasma equirhinis]|uniref:MATE family efflux transporter n=1 Tax=Metamycoplasma equirhinis TaxID=92402 RepID=UPI003594784B
MQNDSIKTRIINLLKIRDFKYIFKLTLPIFVQTLFFAIVSILGSLASTLYLRVYHIDGSFNGYYFYTIAKILSVYKILTFVPIIYQLGVLVVVSNLFGQKREKDIPKVISSSIYISIIINVCCYLIMFGFSGIILAKSGAKDAPIYAWKNKLDYEIYKNNLNIVKNNNLVNVPLDTLVNGGIFKSINFANTNAIQYINNELSFTKKFLRITTIDIFFASIAAILTSVLQAIKKNKFAIIGVILSIFLRTCWTYAIFFVPTLFAKNESEITILISLETILGGIIQLFIAYIFVQRFIFKKYKFKFSGSWNNKYIKEIVRLGLPIAIESGIWYISQYFIAAAIPYSGAPDQFIGIWRALNNTYDIFSSFVLALSYVTSVIVAIEIGKQDFERAHLLGRNSLKLGFYAQVIMSLIGVILTYPMLAIYSTDPKLIRDFGYSITAILMLRAIFDIGNLTTLRALWGANDVWIPNLVAIVTMIGVQLSAVYLVAVIHQTSSFIYAMSHTNFMLLLSAATLLDAIFRTILFGLRWNSKTWIKYAKKL